MVVKKLRKQHQWSQDELAILSGLSIRTIQRVESGQSASLETLKSLAAVFDVEVSVLTKEITTIDKKSENWAAQPFWFRFLFFGISSRRNQILAECSLFALGMLSLFLVQNKYMVASFFSASFITGLAVKYGDRKNLW